MDPVWRARASASASLRGVFADNTADSGPLVVKQLGPRPGSSSLLSPLDYDSLTSCQRRTTTQLRSDGSRREVGRGNKFGMNKCAEDDFSTRNGACAVRSIRPITCLTARSSNALSPLAQSFGLENSPLYCLLASSEFPSCAAALRERKIKVANLPLGPPFDDH